MKNVVLQLSPGKSVTRWDFCQAHPRYSIALDGCVQPRISRINAGRVGLRLTIDRRRSKFSRLPTATLQQPPLIAWKRFWHRLCIGNE
jgi:hypothetical protein